MVWEKVEKLKKVANLVEDLKKENEAFGWILGKYNDNLDVELGTSEEWKDFKRMEKHFDEIKDELNSLQEKASEKLVIEFVGSTSSGKSSLINCLLREDRLPVKNIPTTMCSIQVSTSSSNQWEVFVNGKPQKNKDDKEAVRNLLSKMSDSENRKERKDLGISKQSVVEFCWPKDLNTRLPENVVLVDTPGYGESPKSTKVVTDSCKKADVIVAVTSIESPSLNTISQLVKEAKCQCTFGVYTKWDTYKEEDGGAKVKDARATYEKKYRKHIATDKDDEQLVFFVDVGSVQSIIEAETKGETNDFFKFEKSLAEIAREKKGKLLKRQANSVIRKSEEVLSQFQNIIDKRKKAVQGRLTNEIASFQSGIDKFKKPEEEKYDVFTTGEIKQWIDEFENEGTAGTTPEKELLRQFCVKMNTKVREVVKSKMTIAEKFKKWLDEVQLSKRFRLSWVLPENEVPQLKHLELQNGHYQPLFDPHAYLTNNYLWGTVITGATLATAGAGTAVVAVGSGWTLVTAGLAWLTMEGATGAAAAGAAAGVAAGTAAAGAAGAAGGAPLTFLVKKVFDFGIGDLIKKKYPISRKKIASWKRSLRDELEKLEDTSSNLISEQLNLIFEEISSQLQGAKDQTCKEIANLDSKDHDYNGWTREIDERRQALRPMKDIFDELLPETDENGEQSDLNDQMQRDSNFF